MFEKQKKEAKRVMAHIGPKAGDPCPAVGCKGTLEEKTNRSTGKVFFGCSLFPGCRKTVEIDGTVNNPSPPPSSAPFSLIDGPDAFKNIPTLDLLAAVASRFRKLEAELRTARKLVDGLAEARRLLQETHPEHAEMADFINDDTPEGDEP